MHLLKRGEANSSSCSTPVAFVAYKGAALKGVTVSVLLAQAILVIACASPPFLRVPDAASRSQSAHRMALNSGFEPIAYAPHIGHPQAEGLKLEARPERSKNKTNEGALPVAAWGRNTSKSPATIRIYIEGDGYAWRSRRRISEDPTPVRPVGLELAIADASIYAGSDAGSDADSGADDPEVLIAYLGRPCQYSAPLPVVCQSAIWTHARFGPESLEALSNRIDDLLRHLEESERGRDRATNRDRNALPESLSPRRLTLIGYSGGGVMAALLAATRSDIDRLITVAAPLNVHAWTARAGVSPLFDSLSPMDYQEPLRTIPQVHFAGGKDQSVNLETIRSFVDALRESAPAALQEISLVPAANHADWPAQWSGLLKEAQSSFDSPY